MVFSSNVWKPICSFFSACGNSREPLRVMVIRPHTSTTRYNSTKRNNDLISSGSPNTKDGVRHATPPPPVAGSHAAPNSGLVQWREKCLFGEEQGHLAETASPIAELGSACQAPFSNLHPKLCALHPSQWVHLFLGLAGCRITACYSQAHTPCGISPLP